MTTRSLFQQAFAETGHDSDADTGWTFATQMSSSDPVAWVTDVLWSPSVGATGAYDYRLYTGHIGETRTLVASGALGSYTAGGGWQTFPITPYDMSGLNFMVAIRSSAGTDDTYAYATGKWPASNGPLSGPGASGGAFSTSGGTPDNGSALMFMLDVNVSDTAPGGGGVSMSGSASLGGLTAAAAALRAKSMSAAAALGGLVAIGAAGRSRSIAGAAALGSVTASGAASRARGMSGAAALGRIIGTAHADGAASAIVPGTLTVRDASGAGLVTRERGAGLSVRER